MFDAITYVAVKKYADTKFLGFVPQGDYNVTTEYKYGDWVNANGGSYGYIYPTPSTGVSLADTTHWQQIASMGGQDLVDAAVAARDAAEVYAAQLAAGTASPAGTYANLAALIAADPDHSKIYITLDDGKWCYHNGTTWVAGGVYQASSLVQDISSADKSIKTLEQIALSTIQLFDKTTCTDGYVFNQLTGELVAFAGYSVSAIVPIGENVTYYKNTIRGNTTGTEGGCFNSSGVYLGACTYTDYTRYMKCVTLPNTAYIRFTVPNSLLNTLMMFPYFMPPIYYPLVYKAFGTVVVNDDLIGIAGINAELGDLGDTIDRLTNPDNVVLVTQLFDPDACTDGYLVHGASLTAYEGYSASNLIPISPSGIFYIINNIVKSMTTGMKGSCFSSSMTYIGECEYENFTGYSKHTAIANTAFIRFTMTTESKPTKMVYTDFLPDDYATLRDYGAIVLKPGIAQITELKASVQKRFYYTKVDIYHFVRCGYDDTYDFVNQFALPSNYGNRNFNLVKTALISSSTAYRDTVAATDAAPNYKECLDDIAPVHVNGYFIGANHGNPNYINVTLSAAHSLTSVDIGSSWSDGTYTYILIRATSPTLITLCYLNESYQAEIKSVGAILTHVSGATHTGEITVASSEGAGNFNPCGNYASYIVLGDDGVEAVSGNFYNKIIAHDEYNMLDARDVIDYLVAHIGTNTNSSYYDNDISTELGRISNKYEFGSKGSFTCWSTFLVGKPLTLDYWFGAQSLNFTDDGTSYGYAPNSNNFDVVTLTPSSGALIKKDSAVQPYRFFQINPARTSGYFIYINPEYADGSNDARISLPHASNFSVYRTKFYSLIVRPEAVVPAGYICAFCYTRGPFALDGDHTVNTFFEVGDDIIYMNDEHASVSGLIEAAQDVIGKKITSLDKTSSLTIGKNFVTPFGVSRSVTDGYGYIVAKLE